MKLLHLRSAAGRQRERGAGLIVIIGIIAALAVSAAALVVLTANVQGNTVDTRLHVKSFTVTEAGLDSAMSMLNSSWPVQTSIPTFDATAFRNRFALSDFPNPKTGQFITVQWYDNKTPVDTSLNYDANGDGTLWLVAQAKVGSRATRVVSQVHRDDMPMGLPRGIPLWAGGNLTSNGAGNNPKIVVEVAPPTGTTTTVQVGGSIDTSSVTQSGVAQKQGARGDEITPLEEIFPQALVDSLVATAQGNGRYFTSLTAAEASPVDATWSPTGGLSGLTVIAPPAPTDVKIDGNYILNSEAKPGILMIMGGSTLKWGGNGQFYGVIYCEGAMDTSNGTADIHGMVVTSSNEDLKGTPNIKYNDNCIANLDHTFPGNVKRVKNTWREVQPQ